VNDSTKYLTRKEKNEQKRKCQFKNDTMLQAAKKLGGQKCVQMSRTAIMSQPSGE
jgi:hypothetical protein